MAAAATWWCLAAEGGVASRRGEKRREEERRGEKRKQNIAISHVARMRPSERRVLRLSRRRFASRLDDPTRRAAPTRRCFRARAPPRLGAFSAPPPPPRRFSRCLAAPTERRRRAHFARAQSARPADPGPDRRATPCAVAMLRCVGIMSIILCDARRTRDGRLVMRRSTSARWSTRTRWTRKYTRQGVLNSGDALEVIGARGGVAMTVAAEW